VSEEIQLPRAARVFISFVALLRANGFSVAPEQTTTFLAAIELLGPRSLEHIRQAGVATLAPPPERLATYDRLFDIHFRGSEAIERDWRNLTGRLLGARSCFPVLQIATRCCEVTCPWTYPRRRRQKWSSVITTHSAAAVPFSHSACLSW